MNIIGKWKVAFIDIPFGDFEWRHTIEGHRKHFIENDHEDF